MATQPTMNTKGGCPPLGHGELGEITSCGLQYKAPHSGMLTKRTTTAASASRGVLSAVHWYYQPQQPHAKNGCGTERPSQQQVILPQPVLKRRINFENMLLHYNILTVLIPGISMV